MKRVIYSVEILLGTLVKQTLRTKSASGRLITKKKSIVDYVNHFNFEYLAEALIYIEKYFGFVFHITFFKSTKLRLHSL